MQRFVSASGIAVFLTGAALAPASGANLAPGPQAIALEEIFFWSLLPIAATLCGIVVAVSRPPGPRVRSALQHLAAGIVVAAVAVEIVPEMLAGGHVLFVASGFTLGVGLMFGVRIAIEALEGPASSAEGGTSAWSMLIATGIDLAIDGLLIGLGFAISVSTGALLTIAVTFEMLFIAIGLSATLRGRGFTARFTVVSLCAMALLTAVCMLLGASLLAGLESTSMVFVLSFGAAALLYLAFEELLVEAHEGEADTAVGSMLFFVGFGASLIGAMVI